ncbi:hypothetical protein E2562_031942 [Oryza meyeriana var. granulata]|uniref:DUF834 domain-containing protein n=1 Tax=Oryza meyeriana var. granulata TaxID=110450 RepID=A0A6G1ERS8_9ORYZ|nr:hypothetical protein E2562_031942 [Oryza meyeriana var. granulata]
MGTAVAGGVAGRGRRWRGEPDGGGDGAASGKRGKRDRGARESYLRAQGGGIVAEEAVLERSGHENGGVVGRRRREVEVTGSRAARDRVARDWRLRRLRGRGGWGSAGWRRPGPGQSQTGRARPRGLGPGDGGGSSCWRPSRERKRRRR